MTHMNNGWEEDDEEKPPYCSECNDMSSSCYFCGQEPVIEEEEQTIT